MQGISAYNAIAEPEEIRTLTRVGKKLRGRSFLHVNSTSMGGEVAEILRRLMTLFVDLGQDKPISVEGAAYRIRQLLHNPEWGKRMVQMGREHVRRNFLITRQAKDYLALWMALEHPRDRVIQL